MIIVSSCLAGKECRYNATSSTESIIVQLVQQQKAIMVCPELLGGFSTPREPAEIVGGTGIDVIHGKARVITQSGMDVTELYIKGAERALALADKLQATCIVLKENSPSCGSSYIYNGTFSSKKINGEGVTTALLKHKGYQVISENELIQIL